MNRNLLVTILAGALTLAACQDQASAPASKSPAAGRAGSTQSHPVQSYEPSHESSGQQPAAQSSAAAPQAVSAVAVTKPAESDTAQRLQAGVGQSAVQAAGALAGIKQQPAATQHRDAQPAAAMAAVKTEVVGAKRAATAAVEKQAAAAKPAVVKQAAVKQAAPKRVAMAGDAGRGKSLARKCKACHNFSDKKKVGPGLKGVFGRKAGIMPDMKYGVALAAGGWVWDEAHLAAWICNSKQAIKTFSGNASARTKMGPQRICDPAKQADLIAYLKTL